MKKPIPPCKECTKRHFKCWGECLDYQEYRKELDEYKKIVNKSRLDQYEQNEILRQRFKQK